MTNQNIQQGLTWTVRIFVSAVYQQWLVGGSELELDWAPWRPPWSTSCWVGIIPDSSLSPRARLWAALSWSIWACCVPNLSLVCCNSSNSCSSWGFVVWPSSIVGLVFLLSFFSWQHWKGFCLLLDLLPEFNPLVTSCSLPEFVPPFDSVRRWPVSTLDLLILLSWLVFQELQIVVEEVLLELISIQLLLWPQT